MSENSIDTRPATEEPKPEELIKSDAEVIANNTLQGSAESEPPVKKPRESRRSKGPHKSVDEVTAAEARAVFGDVDTSSGRQLRRREPPPATDKTAKQKPASRTPNKKDTTVTAKKDSPAKSKSKKEEMEEDTEKEESKEEKPLEDDQKECASDTSAAEKRLGETSAGTKQDQVTKVQTPVFSEPSVFVDTKSEGDTTTVGAKAGEAPSGDVSVGEAFKSSVE